MKTAIHVANRVFDELRCASPTATAAMTDDTLLPFDLPSVQRKKLTVDFNGGNQSSDAGLLLLREAERKFVCAAGLRRRCLIAAILIASSTLCSRW